MNKDKFLTTRDKKIKSAKEKADALYNNLSQTDLSYRDSDEHFLKKMFKLFIKYTPYPNEPYSEEGAKILIEYFGRKEFGDKDYEEKFAPIFNKEKKEELKKTAINTEEKKPEQPAPVIKISPPVTNKNCIPYNDGFTPEEIKKNWHKIRPCDPNEIITKKESGPNKFNDPNFKGYY
jgi:hypothetical protein